MTHSTNDRTHRVPRRGVTQPTVRRGGLPAKRQHATDRGVTLVEALVIVAMIGVLSAIAIMSFRRFVGATRIAGTKDLLNLITTAENAYKEDTLGYLDCSNAFDDASLYPMLPNDRKHLFHDTGHSEFACWRALHVDVTEPTYMSFWLRADMTASFPSLPGDMDKTSIALTPTANEPWFVAIAVGDQDANGRRSYFMTHSNAPASIHVENEDE